MTTQELCQRMKSVTEENLLHIVNLLTNTDPAERSWSDVAGKALLKVATYTRLTNELLVQIATRNTAKILIDDVLVGVVASTTNGTVDDKKAELTSLEAKIKQTQQKLESQKLVFQEELKVSHDQLHAIQDQIRIHNDKLQALNKELVGASSTADGGRKRSTSTIDAKIQQKQDELRHLEENIAAHAAELKRLSSHHTETAENLTTTNEILKAKLQDLTETNDILTAKLNAMESNPQMRVSVGNANVGDFGYGVSLDRPTTETLDDLQQRCDMLEMQLSAKECDLFSRDGQMAELAERCELEENRAREIQDELEVAQVKLKALEESVVRETQLRQAAQDRLKKHDSEVLERETKIKELTDRLNGEVNNLRALATQLESREKDIQEYNRKIAELTLKVEDRSNTASKELEQQMKSQDERIEALNIELNDEKNRTAALTKKLESAQRDIDESTAKFSEMMHKTEERTQVTDKIIKGLDNDVVSRDGRISELTNRLTSETTRITTLEAQLAKRDNELADRDKRISELSSRLDGDAQASEGRIKSLEQQVQARDTDLVSRDGRISELTAQLTTETTRITTLEAQLAKRDSELADRDKRLAQLEAGPLTPEKPVYVDPVKVVPSKVLSPDDRKTSTQDVVVTVAPPKVTVSEDASEVHRLRQLVISMESDYTHSLREKDEQIASLQLTSTSASYESSEELAKARNEIQKLRAALHSYTQQASSMQQFKKSVSVLETAVFSADKTFKSRKALLDKMDQDLAVLMRRKEQHEATIKTLSDSITAKQSALTALERDLAQRRKEVVARERADRSVSPAARSKSPNVLRSAISDSQAPPPPISPTPGAQSASLKEVLRVNEVLRTANGELGKKIIALETQLSGLKKSPATLKSAMGEDHDQVLANTPTTKNQVQPVARKLEVYRKAKSIVSSTMGASPVPVPPQTSTTTIPNTTTTVKSVASMAFSMRSRSRSPLLTEKKQELKK